MTSMKFSFDEGAFKREIEKQASSEVGRIARSMSRTLEAVRQQYQGRPIEEIKPALRCAIQRDGGDLTDPDLSEYARLIGDGTKIEVQPGDIKL
jgi:hypothetical protein